MTLQTLQSRGREARLSSLWDFPVCEHKHVGFLQQRRGAYCPTQAESHLRVPTVEALASLLSTRETG